MSLFSQRMTDALVDRSHAKLLRQRVLQTGASGLFLTVDGKSYLNFSSNDYLGHATHPQIKTAMINAVENWGVGTGASHLVTGHTAAHQCLEDTLADLCGTEAAIVFSTGFMANIGVLNALLKKGDVVLEDKLNHASLIDGGFFSEAKFTRYAHNDMNALQSKLVQQNESPCLVVSDAVFSMDGDIAPLPTLLELCNTPTRSLMIDDAHGFGVLGKNGLGTPEHFHLPHQAIPVYMATLGKAMGTCGAFVAGSRTLIDYLVQFARAYIYTTAMPAALAVATTQSLSLLKSESWRREKLWELIAYFTEQAKQKGLAILPSSTAIQGIVVGESAKALALSAALKTEGFWLTAIRPPTVPAQTARLRITLSAMHEKAHIDALLVALVKHGKDL